MCASAWAARAVAELAYEVADRLGVVAEVHLEQRRDLVVARTSGAQPSAELGAEALEQSAFERGVHVLVVGCSGELP